MAESSPTKKVARKYNGNLGYFNRYHPLRRLRWLVLVITLLGGVAGLVWFHEHGSDQFYNPAPLSTVHAGLEKDCAACHRILHRDLTRLLSWRDVRAGVADTTQHGLSTETLRSLSSRLTHGISFQDIDHACQKCHENFDLHQPNRQAFALRELRAELHVARADSCSTCHREHLGRIDLQLPGDSACAACHADAHRMESSLMKVAGAGSKKQGNAVNLATPDGVVHFLPPSRNGAIPLFASFERDHPAFGYEAEGLRDPARLRFNHQRHAAPDIPPVEGARLSCAYCHQPAADGQFYQRISYEANCSACHSLQFDPRNPELKLPHGDPDHVRAFLRSLPFQYASLAAASERTPSEAKAYVNEQMRALKQRVRSGEDFEKQIFFTGNPYQAPSATGERTLFPGCAYCHDVQATASGTPLIAKPGFADRWLTRGPFTHAKHTGISCVSCHDANRSKDTADIIMPSKESCVQCHHQQGAAGANCIACHQFHAPAEVANAAKGSLKDLLLPGRAGP